MTRHLALIGCALAALLAVPSAALATHPPNTSHSFDDFATPQSLPEFDARGPHTTASATVQASEPLTVPDDGSGCTTSGTIGSGGVDMGKTLWYQYVPSESGPTVISTKGSVFERGDGSVEPLDTVVAVYATTGTPTTVNFVRCNDDASATDPFQFASQVTFTATAGTTYKIQVGAWRGTDDGAGGTTQPLLTASGDVVVASAEPLPNDRRAAPETLPFGMTEVYDNLGAGIDTNSLNSPTEDTFCNDSDSSASPVGSTVWFRFVVPADGDVTLTAGPFDTVMQLYRQGQSSPLACNDNRSASVFTSRIQARLGPGTYDVQVGGWRGTQADELQVRADYVQDLDGDDDGHNRPADCDDANVSVNPGATDTPDNGVDEDCSGADATSATTTPPPPPPPTPPPPDVSAPAFTAYALSPAAFPAAPSGPSVRSAGVRRRVYGTVIAYRLDEAATTTFKAERRRPGRRAGRRCVAPTRRNRRARPCWRYVAVRGSFTHAGAPGLNRLRFTGRVGGRKLSPGRYRLVATARDARGNRSSAKRRPFRITR